MCESPAKSAVAENGGITLLARMALFKVSMTCKSKQTGDKNVNKQTKHFFRENNNLHPKDHDGMLPN